MSPEIAGRSVLLACITSLCIALPANAQIRFVDSTDRALGSFRSETWGAAIGDFNGDSWPDIWVDNHRNRPMLYRNEGDGTFTNSILTVAGDEFFVLNRYLDQHSSAWADIDNDGDDDLLMQGNGAGDGTPSALLLSNGSDQLTNRYNSWGLPKFGGRGIGWVDYDLDGDLDIFRSNLGSTSTPKIYIRSAPSQFAGSLPVRGCGGANNILVTDMNENGRLDLLCVSEGDFPRETFRLGPQGPVPIGASLSIPTISHTVDLASADFDNDLDPDLVIARGTLQKNHALPVGTRSLEALIDASPAQGEAGLSFTGGGVLRVTVYGAQPVYVERRGSAGIKTVRERRSTFTLDPSDPQVNGMAINRSGHVLYFGYKPARNRWSIILSSTNTYRAHYITIESSSAMSGLEATGTRAPDGALRPAYLRNNGRGGYTQRSLLSNLPELECNGLAAGDFDNDMDVDLYFVCQRGGENIGNRLFANDGSGRFYEVGDGGGARGPVGPGLLGNKGWGENAAVADFNNDGYLDLFVTNGMNVYPTRNRAGKHKLFTNAGGANNWIKFDLRGITSDPSALGARVYVTSGGRTQMREQNGGYHRFTQNHQRLHFGLAGNTDARVRVRWPDGTEQRFERLEANKTYRLTQGRGADIVRARKVTPFRAPIPGDECGRPRMANDLDRALFIYKDCTNGRWRIVANGGGDLEGTVFAGSISSDIALQSLNTGLLEPGDYASGQRDMYFNLNTRQADVDEVAFNIPSQASNVCLRITSPNNAPIMLGARYRRITDDINLVTLKSCSTTSPPPSGPASLSISDVTVTEGAANANVTISLSGNANASVQVNTRAGTATGGSDYTGFTRTVNFTGGTRSQTINVPILNDVSREPTEQFTLHLGNANGALISRGAATVTVLDDD